MQPSLYPHPGEISQEPEALVERLANLHDGPTVFPAVIALGVRAVPALETTLTESPGYIYAHRRLAADALAAIGESEAVHALRRAMLVVAARDTLTQFHESEAAVVNRIARHLGDVGDARSVDAMLAALKLHPYAGCAVALGRLREGRAIPSLVACLYDDAAREAAMEALRHIGRMSVPALAEALLEPHGANGWEGPVWTEGRASAALVLGQLGGHEAMNALAEALHDRQRPVRIAAAFAASLHGGEPGRLAASALVVEFDEQNWALAQDILDVLVRVGPGIQDRLLDLASRLSGDASDRLRRLRLIDLLGHFDTSAIVIFLASLAHDADPDVRLAAVTALGRIGSTGSAPIENFLYDRSAAVRRHAVHLLGSRQQIPIETLISFLGDSDASVRSSAARLLAESGPAARPVLWKYLRRFGAPLHGALRRWRLWRGALRLVVARASSDTGERTQP